MSGISRARLEAMVQGCPFHRHLGLTLGEYDEDEGRIAIDTEARPEFSRSDERTELHGGIIATLIDLAGDYAVALKVGGGVPTIGLSVDYLRMARGKAVTATARVVKCGRSIAVADIEVHDDEGRLVAVGRGTYSLAAPG